MVVRSRLSGLQALFKASGASSQVFSGTLSAFPPFFSATLTAFGYLGICHHVLRFFSTHVMLSLIILLEISLLCVKLCSSQCVKPVCEAGLWCV